MRHFSTAGAIAASAWIKEHSPVFLGTIIEKGYDGSVEPFCFRSSNNVFSISTYPGPAINEPSTHSLDVWYHVVGVFDGIQNWLLYVNGVLVAAGTGGPPNQNSEDVGLLTSYITGAAQRTIDADVDSVLLWQRGLSASEVAELYRDSYAMFRRRHIFILGSSATVTITLNPDADDSNSGWTTQSGATTNLYLTIDEHATPNDADYVMSSANPVSDVVRFRISDPTVPVTEPFKVHYRYGVVGTGATVKITVRLKQGTTLIKQWVHLDANVTYRTATQVLSSSEFASITDFTNLFVEFVAEPAPAAIVVTFRGWFHQEDGTNTQTQVVNLGTGTADTLVVVGAFGRASEGDPNITINGGAPINKDSFFNDGTAYPVSIQSQNFTSGGNATIFVNWTSQAGSPRDLYVWTITGLSSMVKKNSTVGVHSGGALNAMSVTAGDIVFAVSQNQNTGPVGFATSDEVPTHQYNEPGGPQYNITVAADWTIVNTAGAFVIRISPVGPNPCSCAASYR